jgi:hypothetical protein
VIASPRSELEGFVPILVLLFIISVPSLFLNPIPRTLGFDHLPPRLLPSEFGRYGACRARCS